MEFSKRDLITFHKNGQISDKINDKYESSEDDQSSEDDDECINKTNPASDIDNIITIEEQDLSLSDLQVNNFIIIPVKGLRDKVFKFPARIIEIDNNGDIHIDYLKPDFDKKEVLINPTSESEKNWIIKIEDVIMKLPDPKEDRRGRYIFNGKLILNN